MPADVLPVVAGANPCYLTAPLPQDDDGRVSAHAEKPLLDLAASHGYANGDEDVPFLQAVGHPHPVNPQKRLAREASARGWPVLNFRRRPRRLDPTPAFRTASMYGSLLAASGTGLTMGVLNRDRRRGVDVATSVFGDLAGAVGDIKIEVVGQQHLWSHRPAVFLINHQSARRPVPLSRPIRVA